MAVSLSIMMGRLGGTLGVNMIALLIENHCQLTFGMSATVCLIGGLLTFAIPNIMKKDASLASTTTNAATEPPLRDEQLKLLDIATVENNFKTQPPQLKQ